MESGRRRWAWHVARIAEMRNTYVYNISVGKLEGERPLKRPRRTLEDKIRKDLREIMWEVVDWMHLVQNRDRWQAFVNTIMKLLVP
jgi:hypothetical protein